MEKLNIEIKKHAVLKHVSCIICLFFFLSTPIKIKLSIKSTKMPGSSAQVFDFVGNILGKATRESNNKRALDERDSSLNDDESLNKEEMNETRDISNRCFYKVFKALFNRMVAVEESLNAKKEKIEEQTSLINKLEERIGILEKEVEETKLNNVEMAESAQMSNKESSMWSAKVKGKLRNEED